jgi:hypothetical protein
MRGKAVVKPVVKGRPHIQSQIVAKIHEFRILMHYPHPSVKYLKTNNLGFYFGNELKN